LVEEFEPVVRARDGVGEPFVEPEFGWSGEGGGGVGRAGGRGGENPGAVFVTADRPILDLSSEGESIDACAGRVVEAEGLAFVFEAEAGMESWRVGAAIAPNE